MWLEHGVGDHAFFSRKQRETEGLIRIKSRFFLDLIERSSLYPYIIVYGFISIGLKLFILSESL